MQPAPIKSRIAPTPSGYLHLGNLCSFVRTWLTIRKMHGTLLLRIDDIDNERCRPAYLHDIFEWLKVLGLDCDEGPLSIADFEENWTQQKRLPMYQSMLQRLVDLNLVYACNCSRKKIMATSIDGRYHGACRGKRLSLHGKDVVWRLAVPEDLEVQWNDERLGACRYAPAQLMGDFVIRRKNGMPSYQVASLADDIFFRINYIVRGADLLPSTTAQLCLAQLLQENSFLQTRFCHHSLISDASGNKLSKSAGALAVHKPHNQADVSEILTAIASTLWNGQQLPALHTLQDLLRFSMEHPFTW